MAHAQPRRLRRRRYRRLAVIQSMDDKVKRQGTQPNDTIAAMTKQLYLPRRHRYTDSRYERSIGAPRHLVRPRC